MSMKIKFQLKKLNDLKLIILNFFYILNKIKTISFKKL